MTTSVGRSAIGALVGLAIVATGCASDDPLDGAPVDDASVDDASVDNASVEQRCEAATDLDAAVLVFFDHLDAESFTYDLGYEGDAADVIRRARNAVASAGNDWSSTFAAVLVKFERYWSAVLPQHAPDEPQNVIGNARAVDRQLRNDLVASSAELRDECGSVRPPDLGEARPCTVTEPFGDLIGCDLSGRDLSGIDLRGALLQLADLSETNLEGADLTGADLLGVTLEGASLDGATFHNADLRFTDLTTTSLTGANFTDALLVATPLPDLLTDVVLDGATLGVRQMHGVDFRRSSLRHTNLRHVDLFRSRLDGVDLTGVLMIDAKLVEASLIDADLAGAFLPGADLSDASLAGADMRDVLLAGATLAGTDLSGVDLSESVFDHADLTNADLAGAVLTNTRWDTTTCPDGTSSNDASDQTCRQHLG